MLLLKAIVCFRSAATRREINTRTRQANADAISYLCLCMILLHTFFSLFVLTVFLPHLHCRGKSTISAGFPSRASSIFLSPQIFGAPRSGISRCGTWSLTSAPPECYAWLKELSQVHLSIGLEAWRHRAMGIMLEAAAGWAARVCAMASIVIYEAVLQGVHKSPVGFSIAKPTNPDQTGGLSS